MRSINFCVKTVDKLCVGIVFQWIVQYHYISGNHKDIINLMRMRSEIVIESHNAHSIQVPPLCEAVDCILLHDLFERASQP